jgi:beta-N-acetylhexosaminidase
MFIQKNQGVMTKKSPIILAILFFISASALLPKTSRRSASNFQISAPDKIWVGKTLKSLTLREKIAQLVQIRVQGKFLNRQSPEFQSLKEHVVKIRVGGVVLFAGNVYESAVLLNDLQTASKLPLLVSADFERGASFRISDTTSFPWTMAIGATQSDEFAFQEGRITAQESRAMGVHWIFAPVLDVNNNPENPVINIRSFGEDPERVARLGAAFIRGARQGGVLTTAKHFPGHGDTSTDSHVGLPVVQSDLSRLESVEFLPFRTAIAAGVDSVMTAHVAVPQVTGQPKTPATLDPRILTDLLRNSLHFNGLVVTDALEMGGITGQYWCGLAAVKAMQAGADVLLLPPDALIAINEVERAVRRGDISESRIDQSVEKMLALKSSLGLSRNRTAPISRIGSIIGSPENARVSQDIADRSITAVKDELHLLPISPLERKKIFSLALTTDLESSPLSIFQGEMRRRFPGIRTAWVNARVPDEVETDIEEAAAQSDLIIFSTLVRLTSGQDNISIPGTQRRLIRRLLAFPKPVLWLAFGNPYVLRMAPEVVAYVCTFSYSDVSQIAAAKALSGEISVNGRLPVSIPGLFRCGSGLSIPKLEMTLRSAESASFEIPNFNEARQLVSSFIGEKLIPGATIIVGYRNFIAWEHAAGKVSNSETSAPAATDAVYDLSSLGRVVGTVSAAMAAVDSGNLILNEPAADYLPEKFPSGSVPRVQDLLSLISDSPVGASQKPGTDILLLDEIISRSSGSSMDQLLAARIFKPLGMKNTSFISSQGSAKAPTVIKPGSFSSARDLATFAQMLLNGGIYDHRRYFADSTLVRFTGARNQPGNTLALGWSKPSTSDWTGGSLSPTAFGHDAVSGSSLWIDPAKQMFIVFLTNAAPKESAAKVQREVVQSLAHAVP